MGDSKASFDPRAARHEANKSRILREAWELARKDGIAALSLGALAKRVGLRQPSLYTYFVSKSDLYDEMFAQANVELWAEVAERRYPSDPKRALVEMTRAIVRFASADPARYQLQFQRPIPAFEPSASSYAHAQRFYAWALEMLRRAGVRRPNDVDLYTALVAGLCDQQVANDPGGERWVRLSEEMVGLFLSRAGRASSRR